MNRFLHGHATHPDWRVAAALAAAQIEAQRRLAGHAAHPTLGWVYLTDAYAAHAAQLLDELHARWPEVEWVGATGLGIAASGVEYIDEPALALMLCDLAPEHFRVYSGARPLGRFDAHTAQVHADASTLDLSALIQDMSERTVTGYLFGGLASGRGPARHIAQGVLCGGLSGVAFDALVPLVSRVTQGCQPVGPTRRVTACERNVVTALDGEPALGCLLRDLQLEGVEPRQALPQLRQVLVGIRDPLAEPAVPSTAAARHAQTPVERRGAFGADTRVRHLVGLDPARQGVAIGDELKVGMTVAFCRRNAQAARRDLVRICAEVREELEPALSTWLDAAAPAGGDARLAPAPSAMDITGTIAGAIYVSCVARGGAHFGGPNAELATVQQALGDVPLVGLFAAGEIAHRHLYGYTGVLTVFRR